MIDVSRALVDALRADVVLADMLGTFRDHPAVFASEPVPEGTGVPFVVTVGVSDETFDVKTPYTRDIEHEVSVYDDETASIVAVENIAEHLRERFRSTFPVTDWTMPVIDASGPVPNDVDGYHSRLLTVRVLLERD